MKKLARYKLFDAEGNLVAYEPQYMIAERLGVAQSTIYNHGIKGTPICGYTVKRVEYMEFDRETIVNMLNAGKKYSDIASVMKTDPLTMKDYCMKHGYTYERAKKGTLTVETQRNILDGWYKTCPICGKEFYAADFTQWVYKVQINGNTKLVCTYSCMNKGQNGKPKVRAVRDGKFI